MSNLEDLEQKYNLEIAEIVSKIKKIKKKNPKVLLQFPDGLKVYATEIVSKLEEKLKSEKRKPELVIWLGSCFGACDIPNNDADLIIQFGHAPWKYK